jgi:hypothetical protein
MAGLVQVCHSESPNAFWVNKNKKTGVIMNYSLLTLAVAAAFSASVAAAPAYAIQPTELFNDAGLRCTNTSSPSSGNVDVKVYFKSNLAYAGSLQPYYPNETLFELCQRTLREACDWLSTHIQPSFTPVPIHVRYSIEILGGPNGSTREKGIYTCG